MNVNGLPVTVVGAGRIGTVHALNLCALGAEVTVVEPDPGRARQLVAEDRLTVVRGIDEIRDVAGFVVCSPTDTHHAVVSEVLSRRVPVLLEKPCCADPDTSRMLGKAADDMGVPLFIGFQRRFAPEYVRLRDEMRRSADRFNLATFSSFDGAPPPTGYQVAGGSMAFDLQIHDIDLVLWMFGAPIADVAAVQVNMRGAPDALLTMLRLTNGVACSLVSKRASGQGCEVFAEVVGVRSTLRTTDFLPPRRFADFRERFASAYAAEVRSFVDVAAGRGTDGWLATWRDAVAAEEVCERVDRCLRGEPAGVDPAFPTSLGGRVS